MMMMIEELKVIMMMTNDGNYRKLIADHHFSCSLSYYLVHCTEG